ncbi:hypothetical protein EDD15DRAFT_2201093 [Pisolithus albus]|nr:hypothetical protein EDD15DRAFT_2201093 [Pisolithus albus]
MTVFNLDGMKGVFVAAGAGVDVAFGATFALTSTGLRGVLALDASASALAGLHHEHHRTSREYADRLTCKFGLGYFDSGLSGLGRVAFVAGKVRIPSPCRASPSVEWWRRLLLKCLDVVVQLRETTWITGSGHSRQMSASFFLSLDRQIYGKRFLDATQPRRSATKGGRLWKPQYRLVVMGLERAGKAKNDRAKLTGNGGESSESSKG